MQAIGIQHYGDHNALVDLTVAQPVATDDQVLIKIHAASVNPIDWKLRSGMLKFIIRPKFPAILGYDLSGEIIAVGKNINTFQVGDEVYGCSNHPTGESYAEYIALTPDVIAPKPSQLTHLQAASIPLAGMTAYQSLHKLGKISSASNVLIIGASGGVGMFAVQIAKAAGAKVTAVCHSHSNDFVENFLPDQIIHYDKQNPLHANNQQYDIIFDAVSAHSFAAAKPCLTNKGVYIATLPSPALVLRQCFNFLNQQKAYFVMLKSNATDLAKLSELISSDKLKTHIDQTFNLLEIAKAHQQSETQRTQGKIAIQINS
jgi:NADPH:quinone reductase-like Zn-dependent oxidoreductase